MLKIVPNLEDFARVQALCGRLPDDAGDDERVGRYRLMQTAKLIRLWEHGLLPADAMREIDRILRPTSEPSSENLGGSARPDHGWMIRRWLGRLRRWVLAPRLYRHFVGLVRDRYDRRR